MRPASPLISNGQGGKEKKEKGGGRRQVKKKKEGGRRIAKPLAACPLVERGGKGGGEGGKEKAEKKKGKKSVENTGLHIVFPSRGKGREKGEESIGKGGGGDGRTV